MSDTPVDFPNTPSQPSDSAVVLGFDRAPRSSDDTKAKLQALARIYEVDDLGGDGAAITVEDEGTALSTDATTLNFTGAGVRATGTGAEKTIDIPGPGTPIPINADLFESGDVALTNAATEYTVATVNVTPGSAAAKFAILFNATGKGDRTSGQFDAGIDYKVYRDSTLIRTESKDFYTHVASQLQRMQSVVILFDEPATTNQVAYKVTATRGADLENAAVFNRSLLVLELIGANVSLTDDAILDLAKPTRATADRGKALGSSETNQDELALLEFVAPADFELHQESGYMQASSSIANVASDNYLFAVTNDDASTVYNITNAGGNAGWTQVKAASSGRIYLNATMGAAISEFGQAGTPNRATPTFAPGHVLRISPRGTGANIGSYVDLTIGAAHSGYYTWTASAGSGDMTSLNEVYLVGGDTQPTQTVPSEALTNLGGLLPRLVALGSWPAAMASGMASFINANKNLNPLASSYTNLRDNFRDLLNTVFARLDGSNLTAKFKSDVQGPSEPYTVTTDQTRRAYLAVDSDNEWGLNGTPVLGGASVGISWRLDAANYSEVLNRWGTHKRIEFPNGALRIEGSVNELGNRTLQATVVLVEGTLPALNAVSRPTLRGVPTWGDVRDGVRASGSADDDHLVTEKGVRDAVDDAAPDIDDYDALVALMFPTSLSRTYVTGLTNTAGEFTITDPTGALAVYKEIAIDIDSDAKVTEIGVGDWVLVEQTGASLLAQIKVARNNAQDVVRLLYYTDAEATKSGTIAAGAATIRATRYLYHASDVEVDSSGFDGNLGTGDDTVQKVAQAVDDLDVPAALTDAQIGDKAFSNPPALTAAEAAAVQKEIATGRLSKSVAGASDVTLTDAESAYDSIEFTGAITADIVVTLKAKPSGVRLLKNSTTGAFALKAKVTGQADSAAATLKAGNNVVEHDGAALRRQGLAPYSQTFDLPAFSYATAYDVNGDVDADGQYGAYHDVTTGVGLWSWCEREGILNIEALRCLQDGIEGGSGTGHRFASTVNIGNRHYEVLATYDSVNNRLRFRSKRASGSYTATDAPDFPAFTLYNLVPGG